MISIENFHLEINKFPDGTPRIDILQTYFNSNPINIIWRYESNDELMYLIMIKRWFDEKCLSKRINLYLPYIPNARMDRTKNHSEVFSLKYFCEIINYLNFDHVYTLDAHSDVSVALLNNCTNNSPERYIDEVINNINKENLILYFPDTGAAKRYSDLFSDIPYCYGEKKRDWKTGKILGLEIKTNGIDIKNKKILMIDDIISYGGSLYYSAKELKNNGVSEIYAYATHTENSILDTEKGTLIKLLENNTVKKLFTTNSIFTKEHEKIEIVR